METAKKTTALQIRRPIGKSPFSELAGRKVSEYPAILREFSDDQLFNAIKAAKAMAALKINIPAYNGAKAIEFMAKKLLAGKPKQGKRTDLLTSSATDDVKIHRRYRNLPEPENMARLVKTYNKKIVPLTLKEAFNYENSRRYRAGEIYQAIGDDGQVEQRQRRLTKHKKKEKLNEHEIVILSKEDLPVQSDFSDGFRAELQSHIKELERFRELLRNKGYSTVARLSDSYLYNLFSLLKNNK